MLGVSVEFNQSCYRFVLDNLKSSSLLSCLSSDAVLLILSCIQSTRSSDKLVESLKNQKCLKTNLGFRCPSECFLLDPDSEWGCLLQVFGSFPILDLHFYGSSIFSMANELKKLGVMVDFDDASKAFTCTFKQQVSLFSITKENVLSFLSAYRKLKTMKVKFPSELKKCIRQEKWLRTRLGDYRSPNECILFGAEWEPISPISLLPFIDDNSFYGKEIHDYRKELNRLGVIIDFKDGAKFVANGLFLPHDPECLTPRNVYALLDSVKKLKEINADIPTSFLKKVSQKNWLRTHFGYKHPKECLLFDSKWDPLKPDVGPFIDDGYYGPALGSYSDELNVLGVITDINEGCNLLAGYLESHSDFQTICQIYNYLSEHKWESDDENDRKIWIPRGTDNGKWVVPEDCVLHDRKNLFVDQLNVLEKFEYPEDVLSFFASVFHVKVHPSVDDYCKLWTKWESSKRQITHDECCAFWEFVVGNWNPKIEDTFIKNLSKLPVLDPSSGGNGIILSDKCDVFIGDDLFLMDLFRSSSRPIFVWYPQPCPKSLTRTKLVDIYRKLGVCTVSESVKKTISDLDLVEFDSVNSKDEMMKTGLFKLILGFLADPRLKLEVKKRHKAVNRLVAIEAFETLKPMTVGYSLSFSCGEVIEKTAERMIRWDKQNSKLFIQKLEMKKLLNMVLILVKL